ncbi:MAG TPA: hypothetical protein VHW23_00540, partial [Kofleriaceae bacterium]|nr:hypothetical protein [Kofleriaceae bacterium]
LAIRIATEPAEPLRDAPPGFARVVARCLEKDPDRRFQDVGELAHALAACTAAAAPEPVRPDTAGAAIAPPVTPETLETRVVPAGPTSTTLHGASGAVSVARASLTRRGLVSAGVAALLVGAGLAILFGPRYRSASGHGPSAETSAPPPVSAAPATPARLEPAPDPTPIAPPLPPAPPAPVEPAPPPAPAPAAAEAAPPAAAPAVNVDAGASSKPGTSDDKHRRPPPPARRPARAKTKETIGESRI